MRLTYDKMPTIQPVPIRTRGRGFFTAIWVWLTNSRKWIIARDWHFRINDAGYVIPAGFKFDGASIPRGLIHDYAYANECLLKTDGINKGIKMSQKECDKLFREAAIQVNGFKFINYCAWFTLYCFGFIAFRKHRRRRR